MIGDSAPGAAWLGGLCAEPVIMAVTPVCGGGLDPDTELGVHRPRDPPSTGTVASPGSTPAPAQAQLR